MRKYITAKQVEQLQAIRNQVVDLKDKLEALTEELDDRFMEQDDEPLRYRRDAKNMLVALTDAEITLGKAHMELDSAADNAVDIHIRNLAK